jgi:hypothetical protein
MSAHRVFLLATRSANSKTFLFFFFCVLFYCFGFSERAHKIFPSVCTTHTTAFERIIWTFSLSGCGHFHCPVVDIFIVRLWTFSLSGCVGTRRFVSVDNERQNIYGNVADCIAVHGARVA